MVVGVAGCGRMGAPMLAALSDTKFKARGYDIRAPSEFDDLAPIITNDPVVFADGLETLITVVRDISQTEDVLFANGLARAPDLKTLVISSTLSPRYVLQLRDRVPSHLHLIDAPMSGAAIAARERRLSFMLGGAEADLDRIQPLLDAMGAHFHRMGTYGAGMQAKVLNNLCAAASTAMTRLVLDWADQAGVDPGRLLALMHTSSGQNWFASQFDDIEFARDGFGPDNSMGILAKDIDSALDAAPDDADTTLPSAVKTAIRAMKPRP